MEVKNKKTPIYLEEPPLVVDRWIRNLEIDVEMQNNSEYERENINAQTEPREDSLY